MSELRLRPMTEAELEAYLRDAVSSYAEAHVAAGSWAAEGAYERSAAEFVQLLPAGLATEDMLLYMAELGDGDVVGWVWLCLKHPRGGSEFAWIYDIEVVADQRGKGYGRSPPPRQSCGCAGYRRWVRTSSVTTWSPNASTRRPATN